MSPPPHAPGRVVRAARSSPRPAYIYDLGTVRDRIAALRAALPAGARIAYAMKANGNPAVVAAALSWCDGLEVASGGELAAALDLVARAPAAEGSAGSAGSAAPLVLFSGPAKTDADLAAAVAGGAVLNVESLHELRRLTHTGAGPARICLRVNRAHAAVTGSHRMAGVPTAFGIEEELLAEAVRLARRGGHDVLGFHLHAVSNHLDAAAHAAFVRDAAQFSARTARALGVHLRLINAGGGFGVDVTAAVPGPGQFDVDAFAAGLRDLPADLGALLVVEPGRFVAAPAGWYAAEVIDVKRTHGRWFAVVRGGTHHFRLPASWGYSHPFTVLPVDDWPYPFQRPGVTDAVLDVAGEQCNPRDVLARDVPVAAVRAGDVLLFGNTGAYGWEVAHHDFLRLAHPTFVILGPADGTGT